MATQTVNKQPIAGYELKERIGAGGYGEVWRAEAPGGLVKAIKLIYGQMDEMRASSELKSLQRIKQVRHPFLLSLERIEVVDGQLVIVTELADGCLRDRCNECRKEGLSGIPRDELLICLGDAADALDYMNANFSLQHLDVKPENLLLLGGRVKVGDFGLVKDIHDRTVSLMGGLTPLYAPPEVFDGKPSHFSDQYSLAIVYQELLTGTMPFPGKTAAQLAAQHLHGQPRLNSLPDGDQATIHRALAKSPTDRFPTCRAMINELIEAGKARRPTRYSASEPADRSDDAHSARKTDPPGQSSRGTAAFEERTPTPNVMENGTQVQSVTPRVRQLAVTADLPPVVCPPGEALLRPTLFVGLGGLAAATLRGVRQRLFDRIGGLDKLPAIRMLLLDTDRTALYKATQSSTGDSDAGWAFQPHETLALPLRRTQEYRRDSEKFLKWLSRRWLYNIPRSLETEGLRPLGRLAFVDHFEEVRQQLVAALKQIAHSEAAKLSREALGIGFAPQPRVVVVAALGGTGSGMVLDTAYLVRSLFRELNLSQAEVMGVLLHASPCKAMARQLAAVNSYACLNELHHYSQENQGYPGDPACRLPASAMPPFRHAYLLHLGDDLDDQRFAQGVDAVAAYLYRDVATAVGPVLAKCREQSALAPAVEGKLRSFGVCQIGCAGDELAEHAVDLLSRCVVERWAGESAAHAPLLVKGASTRPRRTPTFEASHIARLSLEWAGTLELQTPQLLELADNWVAAGLGKSPAAHITPLVQQFVTQQQVVLGDDASWPIEEFIASLDRMLGPQNDGCKLPTPTAALEKALLKQIEVLAQSRGTALVDWLYQMANSPSAGAHGAHKAAEWFVQHLRGLDKEAREASQNLRQEASLCEQLLRGAPLPDARVALLGKNRGKKAAENEDLLAHLGVRRVAELATRCAIRLVQALLQRVGAAAESLRDLRHSLSGLRNSFVAVLPLEEDEAATGLAAVRWAVGRELQKRWDDLTEKLAAAMSRDVLGEQGLRGLSEDPARLGSMPTQLRQAARRLVRKALGEIDLASWLLEDVEGRLKESFARSQPQLLTECGGGRRVLIAQPAAEERRLPEALRDHFHVEPMVCGDADPNLLICCEAEHISLVRAAQNMTDEWVELPQMAARVRSRNDVAWLPLPD